jgi:hypothetical protein
MRMTIYARVQEYEVQDIKYSDHALLDTVD